MKIKEKFVTDAEGNRVAVLLDIEVYRKMLEAWEDLEDIRAYEEAEAANEELIPLEEVGKEIERTGT